MSKFLFCLVYGSPKLPAASNEHLVRKRGRLHAVTGFVEKNHYLATLSITITRFFYCLYRIARIQGILADAFMYIFKREILVFHNT